MTTAWMEVPLGSVAAIERASIPPEGIQSGTRYVGLENISPEGRFLSVGTVEPGQLASQKFQFSSEHLLYGKLRPYLSKIAAPEFSGVCSTDILPIRVGPNLNKRYLLHFLRQPTEVALATSLAAGANLPRLSPKVLEAMTVAVPPIEEQRRIAAVLDHADALRSKRRAAQDLLNSLAESIFLDMFGNRRSNKLACPVVPLSDLVDPAHPITRGIDQPGPDVKDGVPYIKTTDFKGPIYRDALARSATDIAGRFPRSIVGAGDSVICIRATVGPVALIDESLTGVNLSRGTARVAPAEDVSPRFLHSSLSSQDFQDQITERLRGATFLQIPLGELRDLKVLRPPLDAQAEFAERAAAAFCVTTLARGSLQVLDELFASLQQRAFSGRL